MRAVNFSLLLLLVGCSTAKVKQPVKLPIIQKPRFQSAIQANVSPPSKLYYLMWSNPNPYAVVFQIDSKTNIGWNVYAVGWHTALSEAKVQIYPTNSHELFRVGFH